MNNEKVIASLIKYLNDRTAEYEAGHPTISDKEWDDKYFELVKLEKENNIYLENSPTQKIIYQTVSQLEKVEHNHEMLSLEKTKSLDEAKAFLKKYPYIAMCKMDGLTCSLKYVNGRLVSAETRGDGRIGENILHNANVIPTIPKLIPYRDTLIVDGEIICSKSNFKEFETEYKNPRNFASGSIRLLDSKECSKRKLNFIAWEVIEGFEESCNFLNEKLNKLNEQGFLTVPYLLGSSSDDINKIVDNLVALADNYPIDGIVFKFDNIKYGQSLGKTSHHFKNALAYKFYDETYPSFLREIEWSVGRTGQITPIAIFDPVEIDGTEITRASIHNISIMEEIFHGTPFVGQKIEIFKSNMIIPQIYSAENQKYSSYVEDLVEIPFIHYPNTCPICGNSVRIEDNNGVRTMICFNDNCEGKLINKLDHFCGKKGLDIKGLSKATLEKLIDWGWIKDISDIMVLINHRSEWIQKPGFGQKSVDKILDAIEDAKFTTLDAFISSLGIPLIGNSVSKELVKHIKSYEDFREKANTHFDFSIYDGFAESKTTAIWTYDFTEADKVYPYLYFTTKEKVVESSVNCADIKVVITGKLQHFKNRDAFKDCIEAHGGKVVDSVSKNTTILVNNDVNSNSSKNQTAKKLGVLIMSEQEFLEKFNLI